jgi:hypothetical protein
MDKLTPEMVHEIASAFSKVTGQKWNAKPRSEDERFDKRARIVRADGAYIMLWTVWNDAGKLSITGGLEAPIPEGYSPLHRSQPQSIGVSLAKGSEKVARDISRRLLPEIESYIVEERERREDHTAKRDRMFSVAIAVARALKDKRPSEQGKDVYYLSGRGEDDSRIDAKVHYGGRVTFDFSVEGESAPKVAEAILAAIHGKG